MSRGGFLVLLSELATRRIGLALVVAGLVIPVGVLVWRALAWPPAANADARPMPRPRW